MSKKINPFEMPEDNEITKQPVILFREDRDTEEEFIICNSVFGPSVKKYRTEIPNNSLVIGRYSVLPWYKELEEELALNDSCLINNHIQHQWIADVMAWSGDQDLGIPGVLDGLTPKSWSTWSRLPDNMSFIVKGRTNSRKWKWNTHMFAKTKQDVSIVARRLLDDAFIGEQGLVVREYIPLRTFDHGINGLPITNEWRCFFLGSKLLAKGYYWACAPETWEYAEWTQEAENFVHEAAEKCSKFCNFFVLDIAQREDGGWIVIEVNDGQMSGNSTIDLQELYSSIKNCFK